MGLGIPPILAAAQLLDVGGAVTSVAKGVSSTFSDLLRTAMTDPSEKTPQATVESSVGSTLKPGETERLEDQADEAVRAIADKLKQLLAENGIAVPNGMALQLDALGTIRVEGNHPDAAQIETLLAREIDLTNQFREVAAWSEYVQQLKDAAGGPPVGNGRDRSDERSATVPHRS